MELEDYRDCEIETEYEDRGLGNGYIDLESFSDLEIENEYKSRFLDYQSAEMISIINDINQDKPVLDKIRNLLEKYSGKLITKQIK